MRVKALLLTATYIMIVLAIASILTSCSTLYHACKDGLCR